MDDFLNTRVTSVRIRTSPVSAEAACSLSLSLCVCVCVYAFATLPVSPPHVSCIILLLHSRNILHRGYRAAAIRFGHNFGISISISHDIGHPHPHPQAQAQARRFPPPQPKRTWQSCVADRNIILGKLALTSGVGGCSAQGLTKGFTARPTTTGTSGTRSSGPCLPTSVIRMKLRLWTYLDKQDVQAPAVSRGRSRRSWRQIMAG
jgi:hypothetical protein